VVKTISATQAKNQFGALVESVKDGEGDVIVENRGEPVVAIISASRYDGLERLEKEEKRRKAAETIRSLRGRVLAQSVNFSDQETETFIKQLVDESIESLFAKGKLRYKE
jgi:prevent-host-death family protein